MDELTQALRPLVFQLYDEGPQRLSVLAEREGYVRRETTVADRRVQRLSDPDRAAIERALPALERLVEKEN